jgi:hypothetical protein
MCEAGETDAQWLEKNRDGFYTHVIPSSQLTMQPKLALFP